MNIAVLVKLVPATEAILKIASDRLSIDTSDLNLVLNPFDEYAVEEALQLKAKDGGKVTVISLGGDEAVKALRNALAMGADEAIHIKSSGGLDPVGVAKALASALKDGGFDIVFAGKQAVEDDCSAIGPMVAEFLDIPHVSTITKLTVEDGKLTAEREFEGGVEVYEASLPALITAQKGLNEPRYASLKGIMMAKRKKIAVVDAEASDAKTKIVQLNYPPTRPPGKIVGEGVEAVPELIRLLREEAKVL
ncbi:MAG: electron transfer flavoprotein subunit beta/FixA family protein [Candidatus Electryoneaceae bacterium]|nr:electron transfer flavoprotein subunit beta/FixA family protein [Candidatus Electryoneaceae bacterium]